MSSTNSIARNFGYTDDWLRIGVVTQADLQQQLAEFETSGDKDTSHYRNGAFRNYLRKLDSISDNLLDAFLALSDGDQAANDLSLNRALDVVRSRLLTNSQLHVLRERAAYSQHRSFKVAIDRLLIERRLTERGLTDDIFRDMCELNDSLTLEQLLVRHDISRNHVCWVAEHGCIKRLRNIASQMLESQRFRDSG